MYPNFMGFHQKISFKSALEIFNSASGHLKTALNNPCVMHDFAFFVKCIHSRGTVDSSVVATTY